VKHVQRNSFVIAVSTSLLLIPGAVRAQVPSAVERGYMTIDDNRPWAIVVSLHFPDERRVVLFERYLTSRPPAAHFPGATSASMPESCHRTADDGLCGRAVCLDEV
jgi:hypothetical protein